MDLNHRPDYFSSVLALNHEEIGVLPTELLLHNLNYSTASLLCEIFFLLCCIFATPLHHIKPSLNPSYSPIQLNSLPRTFKPAFKAFVAFLWIGDATWGYTKSTVSEHLITRTLFCPNLLLVLVHHSLSVSSLSIEFSQQTRASFIRSERGIEIRWSSVPEEDNLIIQENSELYK